MTLPSAITIEGYAAIFDVVDNVHDIVQRGAFADACAQPMQNFQILWQHEGQPIGRMESMAEDEVGLKITATIFPERLPEPASSTE